MSIFDEIIISCEHGGNKIPATLKTHFRGTEKILATHRGLDIGALHLAQRLAHRLSAKLHFSVTSRLVVDLNRSADSPTLFSSWTRKLTEDERTEILRRWYWPWRKALFGDIKKLARRGRVLHLSIHTFTPRLRGITRKTDIGILHDPKIPAEATVSARLRDFLREPCPPMSVHINLPYRGTTDSFVTWARISFAPGRYMGLELEVNQKFAQRANWETNCDDIISGILSWVALNGPHGRKSSRRR